MASPAVWAEAVQPGLMIFFLPFLLVDDNYSDAQWWAGADISAAM